MRVSTSRPPLPLYGRPALVLLCVFVVASIAKESVTYFRMSLTYLLMPEWTHEAQYFTFGLSLLVPLVAVLWYATGLSALTLIYKSYTGNNSD